MFACTHAFVVRHKSPLEMSIKVKTKTLVARHSDLPDQIRVDMLNQVVEDFAREVLLALGNLECKQHPHKISQLTIFADRAHTLLIKKKFCCPEFEKLVSLKIER
jgi:hypothetical protein